MYTFSISFDALLRLIYFTGVGLYQGETTKSSLAPYFTLESFLASLCGQISMLRDVRASFICKISRSLESKLSLKEF